MREIISADWDLKSKFQTLIKISRIEQGTAMRLNFLPKNYENEKKIQTNDIRNYENIRSYNFLKPKLKPYF